MTLIRGRGLGLELRLEVTDFETALLDLSAKLSERPGFYRGSSATAVLGDAPAQTQIESLQALLDEHGIELRGVETAAQAGEELARRRAMRPKREMKLSDSARSLVADFAGARADIAERRRRGESSVRRVHREPEPAPAAPPAAAPQLHVAPPPPDTLYHVGTLRGGQSLHHVGNIVVVGDVNPGTELIAAGDILVFGRLLGVAHAGAQGDENAKVYALELQATQLRIATCIALDEEREASSAQPEVAFIRDGRITVAPFSKAAEVFS